MSFVYLKSDIENIKFNNTVSVSSTQYGNTAGGAIILVYKIQ